MRIFKLFCYFCPRYHPIFTLKIKTMTLNEYQQHALETAIYPARDLGYELDDVAQMNVDKLRSRMQRHIISGSGDNR